MSRNAPPAVIVMLAAALCVMLVAGGCGPSHKEPPEVARARETLDEAWSQGGALVSLSLSLFAENPAVPEARAKVLEALDSPSPAVRLEAARAMAAWKDPGTADRFVALLEDDSPLVPLVAARALAQLGRADGRDRLTTALRGADGALQVEVCEALANIGDETCLAEAARDVYDRNAEKSAAAAAVLAAYGEKGRDVLREAIRSPKRIYGARRAPVITALGRVGDASDVDRVLPFTAYRENLLAVLDALSHLGGDKAREHLRSYLPLEDKPVARAAAATALARMGDLDPPVPEVLDELSRSPESAVRYRVADGLREAPGDGRISALLARLAGDEDPAVRKAAVLALEGRTDAAALDGARAAFDAGRDAEQGPAYDAALMALNLAGRIPGEEAEKLLVEALDSENWGYALEAALGILEHNEMREARPAD